MLQTARSRIALFVAAALSLLYVSAPAFAAKKLDGRWQLTITIPQSPETDETMTFSVDLDASPRGSSLHGRLTIRDAEGRTVGGVWRQAGKRVSIAFELPCTPGGQCASLILLGKIKGTDIKKGDVIVMWDTPNDRNHAQFDTSNGSFSGLRLP
jgi:hypothetical protein